jgi:hypothetical protein
MAWRCAVACAALPRRYASRTCSTLPGVVQARRGPVPTRNQEDRGLGGC